MTLATDLKSMYENTKDAYDAIAALGGTLPTDQNLQNLVAAFNTLPVKNLWDINNPTLTGLKYAIDNDLDIPVGTEIPDTWNGDSNPLIVAQKLDSSNNSSYGGAEGYILIRKYVDPIAQVFGDSNIYTSSSIRNYLNDTYYNNSSDDLKPLISSINIPSYNGTSIVSVSSKWFLMSVNEIGGTFTHTDEGFFWDYWKLKIGTSTPIPNNEASAGRIVTSRTGEARPFWLRSIGGGSNALFVHQTGTIGSVSSAPSNSPGVLPACFIAKSNPSPASYTVTFEANGATNVPAPQIITEGGVATKPADPVKTGYNFEGWTLNGVEYDFSTPVTGNITLVASFVKAYDPTNPTITGLKSALDAGDYAAFPVGTEIPDTYNGNSNPLIVAQYLDSSNNSTYGGATGVILIRKYVDPTSQRFNSTSSSEYKDSSIENYLKTTYASRCSDEIKKMISEIQVPCYTINTSNIISVPATWFIMSNIEVGGASTRKEGFFWNYWKIKTGLTSGSNLGNNGRKVMSRDSNYSAYWLRSLDSSTKSYFVNIYGELGTVGSTSNAYGVLPACFIAKS